MNDLIYRGVRYDRSAVQAEAQPALRQLRYRGASYTSGLRGQTSLARTAQRIYRGTLYVKDGFGGVDRGASIAAPSFGLASGAAFGAG